MGTPLPLPKRGPKFSAHVYCDQTAGWIKMAFGMEAGLGPNYIVLDCVRWGPSSPPQKGGGAPSLIFGPCLLWSNGWMDQDGTWHEGGPWSMPHCARWGPSSSPQKRGESPQFSARFYYGQTAGYIKMPLGTEVVIGLRDIVLDGDPAPPSLKGHKGAQTPNFRPMSVVAKRQDGLRCHLVWR